MTCRTLEIFYHINAHTFEKQYKETLSGFRGWEQLDHADTWLLFTENMGPHLAIDETSLSNGELYTFVTNRDRHAGERSLVAVVSGTKSEDVIRVLKQVTDDDIQKLSDKLIAMAEENGMKFFLRDADNILQAECIMIVGTRSLAQGLNCGHCGFPTCASRPEGVPCALNTVDVGIAVGSACATAADLRVDTRVMFSAGLAAQQLGWLKNCATVFAIPITASSKNPFFDRKPKG